MCELFHSDDCSKTQQERRRQARHASHPSRTCTISVGLLLLVSIPFCSSFTIHTPVSLRQSSHVVLSAQRRSGRTRPHNKNSVHAVRRKNKVTSIQPTDWEPVRKRNINKQFTSRHTQYEEERLHGVSRKAEEFVPLKSDESKLPSQKERENLTNKIAQLLQDEDDDGDELFVDDTSDVADKQTVFKKLSDEEKSQASFAVSKRRNRLSIEEPSLKMGTKVTANVLETGQDTMKQYVKSMGQHQVLSPEDEAVLGRQIQIFNAWERKRQKLEEQLLR